MAELIRCQPLFDAAHECGVDLLSRWANLPAMTGVEAGQHLDALIGWMLGVPVYCQSFSWATAENLEI